MDVFGYFAPRVKAFLMRRGTPAAAAEELAQETLLAVWNKAALFDAQRAGAAAWIFTIARNLRIDALRRAERARLHEIDDPNARDEPEPPDCIVLAGEREQRIRAALKDLSAEQMRVIELSFFEDKAHGEIADLLGIPLGTVKSRLRLAMNRLRDLLVDLK